MWLMVRSSHREECAISLKTLQLILQDVPVTVATNDEHYLPESHLIEILTAVPSNLAHHLLEQVVSGYAFFCCSSFPSSSVSGVTTVGTLYHSLRSRMTVVMSVVISPGVAL